MMLSPTRREEKCRRASGLERPSRAALSLLALSSACVSGAQAFETTLGAVPCRPMPGKVYRLLKRGIESWQPGERLREFEEKNKAEALAVFERWSRAPWPDLTGLGRVRVVLAEKPKAKVLPTEINAWKISDRLLLLDDFTVRPVGRDTVTPLAYADELREMVAYAETEAVGMTGRNWLFLRGLRLKTSPLFPWYIRVHHAYAAALLGHEEAAAPLVRAAMHSHGELKRHAYDQAARDRMHAAMRAFHAGSRREELLAALEEAHVLYPESECGWEVVSLIGPLKRELAEGPPGYVRKRPEERDEEEQIRALIYEFRHIAGSQAGIPGYPDVSENRSFAPRVNPATRLVACGQKAIPYLIDALDDYTPTRTLGHRWRSRLLRRMDVAMHVIEDIAGCDFYDEASTSGDLHNDTPERRDSAVANAKKWWAMSKGASQAKMIRNQLSLWETNASLRIYQRRRAICNLALIDGPDKALAEIMRLPDDTPEDRWGEDKRSSREIAMEESDPRRTILAKFRRFWEKRSKYGDYSDVVKYGDKRVYAELARRFETTGTFDPTSHDRYLQFQLPDVARYGKNWAIPILARALTRTEMKRRRVDGEVMPCSTADAAVQELQALVGRDFGHRKKGQKEERLAAITRARAWWQGEGRDALAARIAEDRPPGGGSGDLFMTDDEIEACRTAILGDDAGLRRKTIAELGQASHCRIQRALLAALEREPESGERAAILRVLKHHAGPWHLPAVVKAMEEDADVEVRVEAARVILAVDPAGPRWNLKPCLAAVKSAGRLARDPEAPARARRAASEVLMSRYSWSARWLEELPVLRELADDPEFRNFDKLQSCLRDREKALERIRAYQEKQRKGR